MLVKKWTRSCSVFFRIILLWLIYDQGISGCDAADTRYAKKLVDDIFFEYKMSLRPLNDTINALHVNFSVLLNQAIELDEQTQTLTVSLLIRQEWMDPKLSWSPRKYDKLENLWLPARKIWHPDVTLYNSADGMYWFNADTNIFVTFNGKVRWDQQVLTKTVCQMDFTNFPFDAHFCSLVYGSLTYTIKQLVMDSNQVDVSSIQPFISNADWEVIGITRRQGSKQSTTYQDPISTVEIGISLKRKSLYGVFMCIIPSASISVLLLATLCSAANSSWTISFKISIFIALVVLQSMMVQRVPVSDTMPIVGKYYISTMTLLAFSIVISIFVRNSQFHDENSRPVPRWIKKYVLRFLARLFRVRKRIDEEQMKEKRVTQNGDLKTHLLHADEEDSTPFLNSPRKAKNVIPLENIFSTASTAANSISHVPRSEYKEAGSTMHTKAAVTSTLPWNPAHVTPLYCGSNSTFPRITAETNRSSCSTPNGKVGSSPNQHEIAQYMLNHAYQRPVLKNSMSQSIARIGSRSGTPVSVMQHDIDNISKKRQSLLLMNAETRTADYSDDTEISASTQTSSEPSRYNTQGCSFHYGRNKTSKASSYDGNTSSRHKRLLLSPKSEAQGRSMTVVIDKPLSPCNNITAQASPNSSNSRAFVLGNGVLTDNFPQTTQCELQSSTDKTVAENVDIMVKHIQNQTITLRYMEEWAEVIKVINRFFLCCFAMLHAVFVILILLAIL